jgi:hypothetical protein
MQKMGAVFLQKFYSNTGCGLQFAFDQIFAGWVLKTEQMGWTPAVGTAERAYPFSRSGIAGKPLRPVMLPVRRPHGHPDFHRHSMGTQIVDVPVRFLHGPQVMAQTPGQAAGSEGAARIGIPAAPTFDAAQAAHLNLGRCGQPQHQQIAAGLPRQTIRVNPASTEGVHPLNN